MIDFRSAREQRASAFDFIQVRIASPEEIRGPRDAKERERLEMQGLLATADGSHVWRVAGSDERARWR